MRKNTGSCPKPLAAYRLGLNGRTLPMWRGLFLEWAGDHDTDQGVWLTFAQLNEAVTRLADYLPLLTYERLRPLLREQQKRWTAILYELWASSEAARSPDPATLEKAASDSPPDLLELAERAGAGLADFNTWYELGCAVGECQLRLYRNLEGPLPLPWLLRILKAAHSLPPDQLRRVPVLEAAAELAVSLPELGPVAYLTKVVALTRPGTDVGFGSRSPQFEMERLLQAFDSGLQAALGTFEDVVEDLGKDRKPHWGKDMGELYLGQRVLRRISSTAKAKNVVRVLDAFEEESWVPRIDDPLPREGDQVSDQQRLHETIRSLNTGLAMIRFEADGSGEGIRWK